MTAGFFSRLGERAAAIDSLLCVGLDPHASELPSNTAEAAFDFCKRLIDATAPFAAAYKPNAAFFEAFGAEGVAALKRVIAHVPDGIPVVLDAKRGDIGTTAAAYATAAFEALAAHAITINAYMGADTVLPFASDASRGVFVLCKTSNPSSSELQELPIAGSSSGAEQQQQALFERVAALACEWNVKDNVGLVVGATDADALRRARKAAPGLWILAPGVGAQGGDLEAACAAALDSRGLGLLVPISRGISRAADPAAAAKDFRDRINAARQAAAAAAATGEGASSSSGGDSSSSMAVAPYQSEFIAFAMSQEVLRFGSFTLKSGRQSPYFFNAGLFASGTALTKVASAYAAAVTARDPPLHFDVVFGPAYKGIPLGAAVAMALSSGGRYGDVGFSYNRKEAKDHGEGGKMVGVPLQGKRVLVVDDVITGGTAIREAFQMLREAGATPAGVVIALDRQERTGAVDSEGGDVEKLSAVQQVERDYGVPVISVIGLHNIAAYLTRPGTDPEVLAAVAAYRAHYGV